MSHLTGYTALTVVFGAAAVGSLTYTLKQRKSWGPPIGFGVFSLFSGLLLIYHWSEARTGGALVASVELAAGGRVEVVSVEHTENVVERVMSKGHSSGGWVTYRLQWVDPQLNTATRLEVLPEGLKYVGVEKGCVVFSSGAERARYDPRTLIVATGSCEGS
jgi:hypothetical protein